MKNLKSKVSIALLVAIMGLFGMTSYAQRWQNQPGFRGNCAGQGPMNFLNLTQEQQNQMEKLRAQHLQETQKYRNQLGEKQAHLQTLRTAQNPDMKAINATLAEISDLKLKMTQAREAHIQDVRKILTDEQRAKFDARPHGKGYGKGRMHGAGGPCWK